MDIKENTGVLFKNDRKSDKHPAYKGEINVEGKHYSIALWDRQSSKGTTYLSVAIQEYRDLKNEPKEETREEPKNSYENLDDSLPF